MKIIIFFALLSLSAHPKVDPLGCFKKVEDFFGISPGNEINLRWEEFIEFSPPCRVKIKYEQNTLSSNQDIKQFHFNIATENNGGPLILLAQKNPLIKQTITLCETFKYSDYPGEETLALIILREEDGEKYKFTAKIDKTHNKLSRMLLSEKKFNSYEIVNVCHRPRALDN